jgi:hypothetical protein
MLVSFRYQVQNKRLMRTDVLRILPPISDIGDCVATCANTPFIPNGQFATNTAYFLINTQLAASGFAKQGL